MRRLLSTAFIILALVVGTAGVAPAAHAQFESLVDSPLTTQQANQAAASVVADPNAGGAAGTAVDSKLSGDTATQFGTIMTWIMSLFAWLVGVAAVTLDYAVYYTVITMGNYVHNLTAVGVVWRILRDIGNIMLIFGFVAVGITTILNVDWYGGGKKMLPMMFVAAVFLNFSLFISEAIIDTGNLFATQFFQQINGGTPMTAATLDKITIGKPGLGASSLGNEGISNAIMGKLGLQTIYNVNKNKIVLEGANAWIVGFMGIILFLVTAFVMFSLAFVLIARFVILLFLIILAPVGFAGLAVPGLAKRAKQWWDKLFEQTMTAPVLLLMLYIALTVITDEKFFVGGGNGDWSGFFTSAGLAGFASLLLSFLIAMGLLIAVVIQAKNLSAFGAAGVMKLGQNAASSTVRFAGRSALNTGRWAVNRTAGRGMHAASQAVMRSEIGQTQIGRLAATGLGKAGAGFKEAKEKSAKKHEEYRNSVAKAIEDQHAPAIVAALQNREAEQARVATIQAGHTAEDKPLLDEVRRLEKIVSDNEVSGKKGFDVMAAKESLIKAKQNLETQQNVRKGTRDIRMENAMIGLTAAEEKEKAATDALAEAKKKAAVAYGESARTAITDNPLTWVVSGPGGSAAGNKIIQDTLKKMSDTNKAIDMLKKAFEKEAKVAENSTGTSGKLNEAKGGLAEKIQKETKT